MSVVESILKKDFVAARSQLEEAAALIMVRKLHEMKKRMCAEMKLDGIKPDYDSIEDRRPTKVNVMDKSDRQDVSVSNEAGKGALENPQGVQRDVKSSAPSVTVKRQPPKPSGASAVRDKADDALNEEELDEARIKIVKARIRGGKIQRRKKVSTVPGMTIRNGQLKRMSPAERRKRKLGAKRAKIKRRSKKTQMLRKRKIALRKRKTMGL